MMQVKTGNAGFNALVMAGILFLTGAAQPSDAQEMSRKNASSQPATLSLTREAGVAYLEALAFCLNQIGSPITFDQPARQTILTEITRQFPTLPAAEQVKLATAPAAWQYYKTSWHALNLEQKTAFAYDVLALAFGDDAARQALGLSSAGNGGSATQNYDDAKDDFCTSPDVLAMGGCP